MGWASAGAIFDKVADGLIRAEASDELMRDVLGDLIASLQAEDWDTEDDTLREYLDYPGIVAAFRDNDVYVVCNDETGPDGDWCSEEKDHDGDHRDDAGNTWPQAGDAG